jgi:hypothetical protein
MRGAATNRASFPSAISQPAYVQAVAAAGVATDNSGSMFSDMSSSATNNFSIRGAATNRASDLGATVTQTARSQADADLERVTGKSRSILSATSPSISHSFGVKGAVANNGASGPSALSQSIHGQAALSSGRATGNPTSIFSGYGHYSAGGVPAYPGVLGGLVLGSQTRTAGSWTWTAGRM